MKLFKSLFSIAAATLILAAPAFAGWEYLKTGSANWSEAEFSIDYVEGVDAAGEDIVPGQPFTLAVSEPFNNNSALGNLEVFFRVDALTPSAQDNSNPYPKYQLTFVIEKQVTPDDWAILIQSDGVQGSAALGKTYELFANDGAFHDTGQAFNTDTGQQWFRNIGPSEALRARIIAVNTGYPTPNEADILSMKLTGSRRLY